MSPLINQILTQKAIAGFLKIYEAKQSLSRKTFPLTFLASFGRGIRQAHLSFLPSPQGERKRANKGLVRVRASLGYGEESSTKLAKVLFESRADLRMKEGDFHLGHHITQLLPHIETLALKSIGVKRLLLTKHIQSIGKLNFSAPPGFRFPKDFKNFGRKDIAANHREIRRRLFGARLFHKTFHPPKPRPNFFAGDDSVTAHFLLRDLHDRYHASPDFLMDLYELPKGRWISEDDIVAKHHGKEFVTHKIPAAEDRVSQALRFLLPNIVKGEELGYPADFLSEFGLAFGPKESFQFRGVIEMIFNSALSSSCDDKEALDP
jgi:hypothetical protein